MRGRGRLIGVAALLVLVAGCAGGTELRSGAEASTAPDDAAATSPDTPVANQPAAPSPTDTETDRRDYPDLPGDAGSGVPGDPGTGGVTCPAPPELPEPVAPAAPAPDCNPAPAPEPALTSPRPGMVDVKPIGWETAERVGDGTTLLVSYWSGVEPCAVLDRVEVEETPDSVTVTLFQGADPRARTQVCIEIAEYRAVEVDLAAPLGDRPVVDGAD